MPTLCYRGTRAPLRPHLQYGLYAVSKHVEVLANGIVIFAFKLRSLDLSRAAAAAVAATPVASSMGTWPAPSIPSLSLDGAGAGAGAGVSGMPHTRVTSMGSLASGSDSARLAIDRRSVYTAGGIGAPTLEDRIADMVRDVALHFVLPRTSITPLLDKGALSAQEAAYAYCAWKFAFTFLARSSSDFSRLSAIVKTAPGLADLRAEATALITRLRKAVQSHAYTETQILEAIFRYPAAIAWLYEQFAALHKPVDKSGR